MIETVITVKVLAKLTVEEGEMLGKLIAKQQSTSKLSDGVHLYGALKVTISGVVMTVTKWKV